MATLAEEKIDIGSKESVAAHAKLLRRARDDYHHHMGERVFGYQMRGWLWSAEQLETKRAVSGRIKDFADRVLLEGKIPDHFSRSKRLVSMSSRLAEKIPGLGPA